MFPQDSDIPKDELNTTIDQHFVPMAKVEPPKPGEFDAWKSRLLGELRRVSFNYFPERIPPAKLLEQVSDNEARLETEPGIEVRLKRFSKRPEKQQPKGLLMVVCTFDIPSEGPAKALVYYCFPRGVGATRWTQRDPPNYVKRSHALLGRTVDSGRVWDIVAAARYLRAKYGNEAPLTLLGFGGDSLLAVSATVLEPEIDGVIVVEPPQSFMDPTARLHVPPGVEHVDPPAVPQFLNVLRVCDVPELLGMVAPRQLLIKARNEELKELTDLTKWLTGVYAIAGAPSAFHATPTGGGPWGSGSEKPE